MGGKEELHLWNEEEEKSYEIADQLTDEQRVELRHLLEQYKDTLQDKPGRTLHGSGARNRYSYCKTGETTTLQTTVCIQGPGAERAEGDGERWNCHNIEQ